MPLQPSEATWATKKVFHAHLRVQLGIDADGAVTTHQS